MHPNIVALKEVFLTKAHLAVVMEYVKGANMPTFLAKHAPLPENDARSEAHPRVRCCTPGHTRVWAPLQLTPLLARIGAAPRLPCAAHHLQTASDKRPTNSCSLILHGFADTCRWFFQQLVLVFDFYHRLGVKNREVRLHNLMLASDGTRPVLKISDFEYSKTEQVLHCGSSSPASR